MLAEQKETCWCCGKKRICIPEDPNKAAWATKWYCKMECHSATPAEREKIVEARRQEQYTKPSKPRFAYPCIGGPLDSQYATTADFGDAPRVWNGQGKYTTVGPAGMYHHLKDDYFEFNSGSYRGGRKKIGNFPSMVFIHRSLIKPLISPKDR